VVGDWEASFDKQFVKHQYSNVEPTFKDPVGDVGPIKAYIRDLLAAKDRDLISAYKLGYKVGRLN